MSMDDALLMEAGPLTHLLCDEITKNLHMIEESVDEERYESELHIRYLDATIDVFCGHYGYTPDEFYGLCDLTDDEQNLISEDSTTYIILTKLQRGTEAVAREWQKEQELEDEELDDDDIEEHDSTPPKPNKPIQEKPATDKPAPAPLSAFPKERWVYTEVDEVSQALARVITTLELLLRTIKHNNEIGSENSPLGPLHRKMLLAMIEAMLIELTQPYVQQGRIKGFFKGLGDLFKKGAKEAISKEVTDALGAAADAGKDLVTSIMTSPGIDNLSDLPPGSWSV